MCTVQQIILFRQNSEETHAHSHRREVSQMCTVQQTIWSRWKFEEAHAHSQWREDLKVWNATNHLAKLDR